MLKAIFTAGALGLALAACQTTPAAAPVTNKQLATQEDLGLIIGKTISFNEGQSFRILGNGTIRGRWDGTPLRGTYEMRDGFFCRILTEGPRGPTGEDCQLFVLTGDTIAVTRERGTGASFNYTVS
jgi:hypothetical protein